MISSTLQILLRNDATLYENAVAFCRFSNSNTFYSILFRLLNTFDFDVCAVHWGKNMWGRGYFNMWQARFYRSACHTMSCYLE